jgi:hypothetical protein
MVMGTTCRRKEIVAEFAFGDEFREVLVCCRDETHISGNRFATSDAFEGPLAENAKDFHLCGEVDLADLVEEKRSALGLFKATDAPLESSCERALLVAEKLACQKLGRERGAMNRHKFLLRARAEFVNGPGGEFLSRAAFALHKNGGSGGATCLIVSKTSTIAGERPIMPSTRN